MLESQSFDDVCEYPLLLLNLLRGFVKFFKSCREFSLVIQCGLSSLSCHLPVLFLIEGFSDFRLSM